MTVAKAIQEIDAALFNGDTFDEPEAHAELAAYIERWSKQLAVSATQSEDGDNYAEIKHAGGSAALALGSTYLAPDHGVFVKARATGSVIVKRNDVGLKPGDPIGRGDVITVEWSAAAPDQINALKRETR